MAGFAQPLSMSVTLGPEWQRFRQQLGNHADRQRLEMRTVERSARLIERYAKQFAPQPPGLKGYSRGALRNSITVQPTQPSMDKKVGPTVAYGPFVEFGTGQRGAASGIKPWEGYSYDASGRGWPGMDPQPYMVPALNRALPEVGPYLQALGLEIIGNWQKK